MKFNSYILNENMVDQAIKMVKGLSFKQFAKRAEAAFEEMMDAVIVNDLEPQVISMINKQYGTHYGRMKDMQKLRLRESEEMLNEDLVHWWETVKTELFPTLSFYPGLTVWLEIDKLFQGQDINMTKTIVYALFWVLLISGKYVKGWHTWKKQNPEEYQKERAKGKGGIV